METNLWWAGCTALSLTVAAAFAALLAVYVRNLRRAPSRFGRGLVAFAALFLLEAVFSVGVWLSWRDYSVESALQMMGLRALQIGGVATLLYVSWE